jgi:hypothetical protein
MDERRDSMSRAVRRASFLVAGVLALGALAGQAVSAADTPGNNGTVKIHEGPGEPPPEVRNEPHVCTFHLHFFFSDPEQAGTWEIQEWAPGDKGATALTGTYDTMGDGEDREPDAGAYELPDGHYKLFWDGDLDTNKHDKMKVFWVDCDEGAPVQQTAPPSQPTGSQPTGSQPTGSQPTGSQLPQGGTSGSGPNDVDLAAGGGAGGAITPPPTDTATIATVAEQANWVIAVLIMATIMGIATFLMPVRGRGRSR